MGRRLSVRTLPGGKRLPLLTGQRVPLDRRLPEGTLQAGKRPRSRQAPLDRRLSVRTLRAGKRLPLDRRLSEGTLRAG